MGNLFDCNPFFSDQIALNFCTRNISTVYGLSATFSREYCFSICLRSNEIFLYFQAIEKHNEMVPRNTLTILKKHVPELGTPPILVRMHSRKRKWIAPVGVRKWIAELMWLNHTLVPIIKNKYVTWIMCHVDGCQGWGQVKYLYLVLDANYRVLGTYLYLTFWNSKVLGTYLYLMAKVLDTCPSTQVLLSN